MRISEKIYSLTNISTKPYNWKTIGLPTELVKTYSLLNTDLLSKDNFTYIFKINSILKEINSNSGSESFLSATSKTISGIRKYSTLSPSKNTMIV